MFGCNIQYHCLQTFKQSQALVFKWRPPRELTLINIPWGWEFFGCSVSWRLLRPDLWLGNQTPATQNCSPPKKGIIKQTEPKTNDNSKTKQRKEKKLQNNQRTLRQKQRIKAKLMKTKTKKETKNKKQRKHKKMIKKQNKAEKQKQGNTWNNKKVK